MPGIGQSGPITKAVAGVGGYGSCRFSQYRVSRAEGRIRWRGGGREVVAAHSYQPMNLVLHAGQTSFLSEVLYTANLISIICFKKLVFTLKFEIAMNV